MGLDSNLFPIRTKILIDKGLNTEELLITSKIWLIFSIFLPSISTIIFFLRRQAFGT